MDAIDILGGLFGRKRGGSGKGPDLGEIFGRSKKSAPDRGAGSSSRSQSQQEIDREAKELEDLLNVARERDTQRRSGNAPAPKSTTRSAPAFPRSAPSTPRQAPSRSSIRVNRPAPLPQDKSARQNEQALMLVRAMVNAAKVDGEISVDEQNAIINQFQDGAEEAMEFLRNEISQPLDIREFAWSVPIGLEQQVYAVSLMAIDVDTRAETEYLDELAHGLRLSEEVRDQLQQRFGAKSKR